MSDNAKLAVEIHRSAALPVNYQTEDYLDINAARRDLAKICSNINSVITVADDDDSGFHMIPVRNIVGIQVREVEPELERIKAAERQKAEMREAGARMGRKHLPND